MEIPDFSRDSLEILFLVDVYPPLFEWPARAGCACKSSADRIPTQRERLRIELIQQGE
jgi:hypothetical protein